jgi:hypothetical protein
MHDNGLRLRVVTIKYTELRAVVLLPCVVVVALAAIVRHNTISLASDSGLFFGRRSTSR